jgi:hypothetical protein
MGQRVSAQNFMTLDYPGATNTSLNGIHNAGRIVGQAGSLADWKGFLYDGVTFKDIVVNIAHQGYTIVYGIDQWGDVVGGKFDGSGDFGFAAINGGCTTISPTEAVNAVATSINAQDQIVGAEIVADSGAARGFLYTAGSHSFFDVPISGIPHLSLPATSIGNINDNGRIAGDYRDNGNHFHGFLFDVNGFSYVDIPGATDTHVNGVNNSISSSVPTRMLKARYTVTFVIPRAASCRLTTPVRSVRISMRSTTMARSLATTPIRTEYCMVFATVWQDRFDPMHVGQCGTLFP